ncbi:FIST N-terminal domain-containing protein [Nocardia sp. CNY236]|uniref:FIST signal transduction protein n=1 Tax=Nocardia sp. CNY236 TaxID=1169152 RepID=UPI0004173295|nr:FIST N-terminal domain-containing protein [Nocardia sp. CNY236]
MRIGVGLSTAPAASRAGEQAAVRAREQLAGEAVSLAMLFVSRAHGDEASAVLAGVQRTIQAPALVGCVAQAVVAGRREIENEPAVAVWLASGLPAETFRLNFVRTASGGLLTGYRFDKQTRDLHLLLPDAHSFPAHVLLQHLNTELPGIVTMGGLVSGAPGPDSSRLFRDADVVTSGAVGVRLPGLLSVPVVSQGCRPIGYPYIVTGARGSLITELGGRPPVQRLREIIEVLPPDEQDLFMHSLQIGIVVDEHLAAPGQGDFLIRGVLGADLPSGAVEIGEAVEVGTTVQFQVRDAVGADRDLRATLARASAELSGDPAGALLFTCTGRGRKMFGVADHDAATIVDLLGGIPLAGCFATGEIGPIAGRNALHGFTASMALFVE